MQTKRVIDVVVRKDEFPKVPYHKYVHNQLRERKARIEYCMERKAGADKRLRQRAEKATRFLKNNWSGSTSLNVAESP